MSAHDTPEVGSGETVGERAMCGEVTPHGSHAMPCDSGCQPDWHYDSCAIYGTCRGTPASPDPVRPADAGEGLGDAERALGVYGYDVEHILAAREAAWAEKYAAVVGERDAAEQERDDWRYCAEGLAARAESAQAALATALLEKAEDRARAEAMRRVLDDELANLADDGARLSHSVVRRMEAALGNPPADERTER